MGLPGDAVELGRVVGAWGIKGWIKVQPHAEDPQVLLAARQWHLALPSGGEPLALDVSAARPQGGFVVAGSPAVPDRNAAEALRGATVHVARSRFPEPAADEFYWHDLIGMRVRNREGVELGTVAGLIETGAHSVLRVAAGADVERLIPFVAAYVDAVDAAERCIEVDWGLDY